MWRPDLSANDNVCMMVLKLEDKLMKRILLPGFLISIPIIVISVGSGYLLGAICPSIAQQYNNTQLYRPWSQWVMWLIFVYPFWIGFALAWVWDKVKGLFKGNNTKRALKFANIYWIVVVGPTMIMNYSCFSISFPVILSWTISGYVYGLIAGWFCVKINP